MRHGHKLAGIDCAGSATAGGKRAARCGLTMLAALASAACVAGERLPTADGGLADGPGLRLAVKMDEVVHVDVPFTIGVALRNPGSESVDVMIIHHRTRELPFVASFEYVSEKRHVYGTWLARGDGKAPLVVASWDELCGPEIPATARRGTFCPPTRNVYDIPAGGQVVFEEAVTLRDYASILSESRGGFSGFVAGVHRMVVSVSFIANPAPYMRDVRNAIGRPFSQLETEILFDLETHAR